MKGVNALREKAPIAKKPSSKLVHAIPDEALESFGQMSVASNVFLF